MDVIAVREFEYRAPGAAAPTPARLVLGRPERDGEVWCAPYEIHGISAEPIRKQSYGDDAVQALLLSFQIIAVYLDRCGPALTLAGCEGEPWDHGLPMHLRIDDARPLDEIQAEFARRFPPGA